MCRPTICGSRCTLGTSLGVIFTVRVRLFINAIAAPYRDYAAP
jgi:hypothetical protein